MSKVQGDTTTDFVAEVVPEGKYLVNPYEDWARGERVPILTGRTIDLMAAELRPWPRFDCQGAIAHVDGRCDFLTVFVHEIAPGKSAAPQRHIYDEIAVVLAGTGETAIEIGGESRVVAWGPGTVIGAPTNARYRHRNTGSGPARLICFTDLRYLLSLYRNERFLFDNPASAAPAAWDVVRRVGGGTGGTLLVGSGTIGVDTIAVAAGAATPARRQMQGAHVLALGGEGLTLSWREGASEPIEARWRHGHLVGLPGMHFHQHAGVGPEPAFALDAQLGSAQFPMSRSRRHHYGDTTVYASGSAEIPAGQEPRGVRAKLGR